MVRDVTEREWSGGAHPDGATEAGASDPASRSVTSLPQARMIEPADTEWYLVLCRTYPVALVDRWMDACVGRDEA